MCNTSTTIKNSIVKKEYKNILPKSPKFDLFSPFLGKRKNPKIDKNSIELKNPKFGISIIFYPFLRIIPKRVKK